MTPVKESPLNRTQIGENLNPNVAVSTPKQKSGGSPLVKSAKSKKSVQKMQINSPRNNKIQERKFIVAKKKIKKVESSGTASTATVTATCNCKNKAEGVKKCPCVAYQSLRASQEDFFKKRSSLDHEEKKEEEEEEDTTTTTLAFDPSPSEDVEGSLERVPGSSTIKRRREKVLEVARESIPDTGSGRVMHLVEAFEKLLTIPNSKELKEGGGEGDEECKKGMMKWALPLPGLQPPPPPRVLDTEGTLSSYTPSDFFFCSDNFGLDSRVSSSLDSSRGSLSSRSSGGGRRSRRCSSESTGTFGGSKWKKKQLRVTRQKPFKLRTEQRGSKKEEEFVKKLQEMSMEEEKLRIPIAQGLPWTTDEPECLLKPPVKENTKPIDLKLHTDVRAVERAEFDQYVNEKLSLIEQYKLERERQQKLAEEEEIKRLRRELVPRAQPMPYFDRPFIPQRSLKNPTVPKEPKFHNPQHKKIKCMSWNDISIYTHQH